MNKNIFTVMKSFAMIVVLSIVILSQIISNKKILSLIDKEEVGVNESQENMLVSQFSIDSWETIIDNVKNGNIDYYKVGDIKEIDLGEYGKHIVRISNMSIPEECSDKSFSQTACGFVIEFADIIINYQINEININVGGWPSSKIRKYINYDIYNAFPVELKKGIG